MDPQGTEVEALLTAVAFDGARVLEIGCGDGRLTFRYGAVPRAAVALDPDLGELAAAVENRAGALVAGVRFLAAGATHLPFRDSSFDIAILAWSL